MLSITDLVNVIEHSMGTRNAIKPKTKLSMERWIKSHIT